jgi:alpha-galactosidase
VIPKENPVRPRCPNLVRYEMMDQLGYFLTESSEHFAEYCPWFIKDGRDDLIERYGIPLDEYPTRCEEQIAEWNDHFARLRAGEQMDIVASNEYAAVIMNAEMTDSPATIYGNVRNDGVISNLPSDCIVEVPCMVDSNGIQPTSIGALPPQLAAMMRTNINVQELVVAALVEENREHIFHAAMFDPHTAAELDVTQIRSMTNDLLTAHRDWLPAWTQ